MTNRAPTSFTWNERAVLVTGGASFIGSHLVEALVARGARVRAADDLSSGKLDHIRELVDSGRVEFIEGDLRDTSICRQAVEGMDTVFHLAADHGGRGYVELKQAGPASNLALDGIVFHEAAKARVEQIVFASSGCVYPNNRQTDPDEVVYMTEDLVQPPYDADNMYGWAKLMAELTLQSYHRELGIKTASCRYFTVYGPRAKEDHAVIAMIARAFIKQNPFEIWGTGEQVRNWTYIDDIVEGTILAAECIDDGTAVNLGTMERIRVREAAERILKKTGQDAVIKPLPDMPTGPLNRVADNSLAKELLDWEPKVLFDEGLERTIDWYYKNRTQSDVSDILGSDGLIERTAAPRAPSVA